MIPALTDIYFSASVQKLEPMNSNSPMIETWRWFGPDDNISLTEVRQTGATGIVTALHNVPNGSVWEIDAIQHRKDMIEEAGLTWEVVESVPIHDNIKTGTLGWEMLADTWAQTVVNLAQCGIPTVCYNFMPVLDWTRTDLSYALPDGSQCLRFDNDAFAAFDMFILERPDAAADHQNQAEARAVFDHMDDAAKSKLTSTILAGLPGAEESYSLDQFRAQLARYDGIGPQELRTNLAAFLARVLPVVETVGARLAIHPDDPPRSIFGLPRIVSTSEDLSVIAAMSDSPANGFTFCTGSFGVRSDNDLPAMLQQIGDRVRFLHLRSTKREPSPHNFHEAGHLAGDVDMAKIMEIALQLAQNNGALPFRPDHGHALLHDQKGSSTPGYPLIGRLRGLAELRGLLLGIQHKST